MMASKPYVVTLEQWKQSAIAFSAEADRLDTLHASLIDLIDKTQSCTSGLSFGECLEEIKRRLAQGVLSMREAQDKGSGDMKAICLKCEKYNGPNIPIGSDYAGHICKKCYEKMDDERDSHPLAPGSRVYLIAGMKRKPCYVVRDRHAVLIDGRWYWSDGTAVDGSAMRWEERNG